MEINVVRIDERIILEMMEGFVFFFEESLSKSAFVFPNGYDAANRDFKAGCSPNSDGTSELKGGICVCARGYKFDTNSRSCRKKCV